MSEMITTAEDALNNVFATFKAQWDAAAPLIYSPKPVVLWGMVIGEKPPADQAWVRITMTPVMSDQVAVSSGNGKRRDQTSGLVTVQLYMPIQPNKDGGLLIRRLGECARKAFLKRDVSGTIWFRRARVRYLDPEGMNYRLNVVAEYEYDELN